jgi:hypothetical protein
MAAIDYLTLRSTLIYTSPGVLAPTGSIFTVAASGMQAPITFVSSLGASTVTVSTLQGSTIVANGITLSTLTVSTINGALPGSGSGTALASTMVSIGASTNQTNNFNNGSFTTGWGSTLRTYNVLSTVNKVAMSQNGQYQYALQGTQSSIATYQVSRSADSGNTWQTLTNTGLPVTTYAYQTIASGYPAYSNISLSASGQYALATVNGGQLYISNNANSATPVFTPASVGGAPYIYVPFENSIADSMGNSMVTGTGSPAYVSGKVGSYAINLNNSAAVGGTATQYVRGTWSGASNFTMSGWFNAQTINGTQQLIYSAYQNQFVLLITAANQLQAYTPSGGAGSGIVIGTTSFTITANTWYSFATIYQAGGICSFYVNHSLIGTTTNVGGTGTLTSTQYSLGTYDTSLASAFNGYIDDFRLYNFAASNVVSPIIYLPMEGSLTDIVSATTITPSVSLGYVTGVVGSQSLNLMNTAGGTAIQYVRFNTPNMNAFTVSLWFNIQSYQSSAAQMIFSSGTGGWKIYIDPVTFVIGYNLPLQSIKTTVTVSLNTWYHVTAIYQLNSTCSIYVNGVLCGSIVNNGNNALSTTLSCLGTLDNATTDAFNGYIDDFRLYNSAITYSPIVPMNWSHTAVSASGQYMLAACSSGGLFQSSNFGVSWSQLTVSQIASLVGPGQAATPLNGIIITPQLIGLASSGSWSINGVTWTASASSSRGGYTPNGAFNNDSNSTWSASSVTYSTSGNTSGVYTTIQGSIGTVQGDYLQLRSTIPLIMTSYQFATSNIVAELPKTYYIAGSNDATTWYPIQAGAGGAVTSTATYTTVPGIIIVNSTSTQTFGSSTIATTSYSTSTNAYFYFRLICLSNYNATASYFNIGEWFINFTTPVPLYDVPSSPNTSQITVMPQHTGLPLTGSALITSWTTTNGMNWTGSASSFQSVGNCFSNMFNNKWNSINNAWVSSSRTYTTTGNTSGITTVVQIAGSQTGEWVQLQSCVPLVMLTYQFATGGTPAQLPKTYYIVGSNDGITWYRILYASGDTVPSITSYTLVPDTIIVNNKSTQTFGSSSQTFSSSTITTTTYQDTTPNAYTYFRLICLSNYSATVSYIEIGEWLINFAAVTPNPINALAISNTNMMVAATSTTVPNLTGLAVAAWTANGVNWAASSSSIYNASYQPYNGFNNTPANTWASPVSTYNTTNGAYLGSVSTAIIGIAGSPILGEWLQIQSSVPLVLSSYTFSSGSQSVQLPKIYYIVGSNDGNIWYPIHSASMTVVPLTIANASCINYLMANQGGTQTIQGDQTGSGTFVTYPTTSGNTYTYFRIITTNTWTTATFSSVEIGEWYINFKSGSTYSSTNNGSTWTTTLTAPTNTTMLATAGSYILMSTNQTAYLYSNGISGSYTTPTLPSINAIINCASMSITGQYMVILTQGTSNNVFYSTDYGVSFTALTVGSSLMTSCTMSADGSYITISNATAVYTLNRATQGYSIAVGNRAGLTNQAQNAIAIGNQAGLTNQAQNAIAIGNQAGQTNQSANSIILNASGATVNSYLPGFYVAPIATYASSSTAFFSILGYGSDSQVVQTGVTVLSSGYIGIGTTNPTTPCTIYSSGTNTAYLSIYGPGTAGNTAGINISPWGGTLRPGGTATTIWALDDSAFSAHLLFGTAATGSPGSSTVTERMRITSAGNVGIGTATPGYALHVVGAIYATGDVTCFSDQRYKQNIIRLDRSLDAIRSLGGYSYTREDYRPGEKQIGLLAQEVLTVFPEAISHDSTNDKYSVNYNCLIAPVVEAIKELYDRSEAQAEIIKTQQSVMESQDKTIQLLLARLGPQ